MNIQLESKSNAISEEMLQNIFKNFKKRLDECIKNKGFHFKPQDISKLNILINTIKFK